MRLVTCGLILATAAAAAALQDKAQLRAALKDTEPTADWIYDDLGAGFAAAKKSGRPLMVVFR